MDTAMSEKKTGSKEAQATELSSEDLEKAQGGGVLSIPIGSVVPKKKDETAIVVEYIER
jgi:hypothetical protein